jgi:phosphopentomutase
MKRAILIVLDGCGAGTAPDAARFGDHDSPSTLANVWRVAGPVNAPALSSLGFFTAAGIEGPVPSSEAAFGRLQEVSQGKDSVTGHWEMMGIITSVAFPTYPEGFPIDLIKEFEARIGRQTLGNRAASGTAIIAELGQMHLDSHAPIVYTSADSVFQVAAHEDVVPIEKLYAWCEIARELCQVPDNVQRVIARPFIGSAQSGFTRTERRKDYPLTAPPNLVDEVGDVFGIGVVPELFGGRGFRSVRRTQSNAEHALMLTEALNSDARFIFANFEDTDMLFGHRNDPNGFARCLEAFDTVLANLLATRRPDDLVIVTADHGNDPTTRSTDHSREYVPVAMIGHSSKGGFDDLVGMDHLATWIAEHLGVKFRR